MATYTVRLNMLDSDPSTWGTWLDDAVEMTLPSVGGGENEIDTFMGYYPCILDPTNQTAREIKPNNYNKYLDDTNVTLNDGDTMVYFPNRGYKIAWHDANTLDVSVTDEPNQTRFVYMTYYGHPCNGIYIGAYEGYVSSNKLYSKPSYTPTGTKTISDFRQYAQARGSKYELLSFYPLTYLQCCALIKYRGNNIQNILGRGYVDANQSIHVTGGADTRGLNFGESTGKYQCKLFGIEDFYGNVWNNIDGIVTDSNYHVLTSDGNFNDSGNGYTDQGACTLADATGAYHRPKATTSKMGFIPDGNYIDSSDTSYTTYFCDRASLRTSSVMIFGGQRAFDNRSGLFTVYASNPPSSTHAMYCSRLSYFDVESSENDGYKNIRIKIDNQIVATQEIIDRVSITYGCTDGSAPAVGTTYSPHCDVEINSNEIYGDSRLDAIKMGAIFVVECEFEYGTYTPLGRFEIGQPVQNTDDYAISFSGEGMLGSVLARKKMNWANMKQYSSIGVLTVAEALELVHIQFPTITIQTPSSEYLPSGFSNARIVVPTSLKKWKKGVIYKKRFVKLTVRDFIAGIAFMMGGNVIEYGSTIRIITMKEALDNNTSNDYFTADSYDQGYTYEKKAYAPKEVILKTYETTAVQKKRGSGSATTYGYCYTTECECASVYNPTIPQGENKYTINVDCQWIGRSFEAFYFSGSVSGDSGIYDDATPIHEYPSDKFDYTPCTFNFSGWDEAFKPSFFINVQGTRKNTETQVETPFTITAYIMDMTFEWNGTISVAVNSGYNGDSSEITVTIGTNELSNAWDDGTNVPELAVEKLPSPTDLQYVNLGMDVEI